MKLWSIAGTLPGGSQIFSSVLSRAIPQWGSIPFALQTYNRGEVCIKMHYTRRVQDEKQNVHPMALATLGELTSELCLLSTLTDNCELSLVGFHIDLEKSADSPVLAKASYPARPRQTESLTAVRVDLTSLSGEKIGVVMSTWRVSPNPSH